MVSLPEMDLEQNLHLHQHTSTSPEPEPTPNYRGAKQLLLSTYSSSKNITGGEE
jgi:hypothetical protein